MSKQLNPLIKEQKFRLYLCFFDIRKFSINCEEGLDEKVAAVAPRDYIKFQRCNMFQYVHEVHEETMDWAKSSLKWHEHSMHHLNANQFVRSSDWQIDLERNGRTSKRSISALYQIGIYINNNDLRMSELQEVLITIELEPMPTPPKKFS